MKELPENSVNLAILDPPYYKIVSDDWDNQWKTLDSYISWLETVLIEVKRVLKDNGSLYIFGDDRTIAYVQVMADKHFNFLNHLIWYKRNNIALKWAHNDRKYAPASERILFYCMGNDFCEWDTTGLQMVKLDVNNFQTLRTYFKEFQEALGIPKKKIIELIGQSADHCFRWGSTQWDLPTEETYKELCKLPLQKEFIRREYKFIRREYEDLRREYEDLRRPFNYQKGMYEVFDIPIIGGKENTEHSTTKPKELIKRLIEVSSNPGDIVLDPFLGSGTTLRACRETGRDCIGFEKDKKYESIIRERAMLDTPELSSYL
ncbi:MAG: site-specific DNA-methyltransferase [Dehalococcoidales bacterium]|nr:site-specific DNA-methyltransferase [Dehalococcoidales bacterium]